jgi:hypothetical protein
LCSAFQVRASRQVFDEGDHDHDRRAHDGGSKQYFDGLCRTVKLGRERITLDPSLADGRLGMAATSAPWIRIGWMFPVLPALLRNHLGS